MSTYCLTLGRAALTMILAASLGKAQATTYQVAESIGAGGVTGTITTDGQFGVLGLADITGWDLLLTGSGGVTYALNSADGLSAASMSDAAHEGDFSAGTVDITADASHMYFDFSAGDGGVFGFQSLPRGGSQHYWCNASSNSVDCDQGRTVAPLLDIAPSAVVVPTSGVQVIASVTSVPEPLPAAMLALGLGLVGGLARLRR